MPDPVPDRDLLASDGGAAGFRIVYERHVHAVVAYVARRTNRPDLVLDVVAETFARALEHRAQYDATRGPAIAWLFGIARNEIAAAVRRGRVADEARKRVGMALIELDEDAEAAMQRHMRVDLREALAGLAPEQREAVFRRVLAEEPYAAIAERVGCSEQVVRKRVSRGLASLRQSMQGGE
ncbi:RNA polymerase sigma factor [Buttiauxella gaviniae]|uniref:RNA polymerase sigma factor n=1 Tax=Buttiauxella gaviniae TaxID=82990 RepID=UPI003BB55B8B